MNTRKTIRITSLRLTWKFLSIQSLRTAQFLRLRSLRKFRLILEFRSLMTQNFRLTSYIQMKLHLQILCSTQIPEQMFMKIRYGRKPSSIRWLLSQNTLSHPILRISHRVKDRLRSKICSMAHRQLISKQPLRSTQCRLILNII